MPIPIRLLPLRPLLAAAAFALALAAPALAQDPSAGREPPTSWIDPDTGHRVIRLTREPGSSSFYFNDNCFTPDGREMVYNTRAGISVLNLATLASRQVVAGPARTIVVGHRTPTIYYTKRATDRLSSLWCTNVDTGETRKIADLPPRASISAINADETLGGGTYLDGDAVAPGEFGGARPAAQNRNGMQSPDKFKMMAQRLAAKLPNSMFTLDLRTGQVKVILHNTDWLNHLQFSPTDPTLLMYCHEGTWQRVDRIWTIRTDGTQNTLVHHRTMEMEQDGHEWWSQDGQNIWYDNRMPEGVLSYIAGKNVVTGRRTWLLVERSAWSIHYNSSPDGTLFCGDGADAPPAWWATKANKWIYLFHPEPLKDDHTLGTDLIQGGTVRAEKLVNMSRHIYMLEPNPFFTPDQKLVVFVSNMFGPNYVFGVEVAKADGAVKP
jgi:oligogalacturonide lyase